LSYFVVLPDGQKFGPADIQLLNQWVTEGRVLHNTMLEESMSGRRLPASAVPGIQLLAQQAPGPYTHPGQVPSQPYSGYYRGAVLDNGQSDLTLAYVFGSLGLIMCFGSGLCGLCGLVGLVFPILGVVFAKKAEVKGNPGANGAKVLGWIGIALQILAILGFVGLYAFGSMSGF
jgi:hypothetical protein